MQRRLKGKEIVGFANYSRVKEGGQVELAAKN